MVMYFYHQNKSANIKKHSLNDKVTLLHINIGLANLPKVTEESRSSTFKSLELYWEPCKVQPFLCNQPLVARSFHLFVFSYAINKKNYNFDDFSLALFKLFTCHVEI